MHFFQLIDQIWSSLECSNTFSLHIVMEVKVEATEWHANSRARIPWNLKSQKGVS